MIDKPELDNKEEYRGVPVWKIRRNGKLKPIKNKLDKLFPGGWGFDEIVNLMLEKDSRETDSETVERQSIDQEADRPVDSEPSVSVRKQAYLGHFANISPNDNQVLDSICNIEEHLEQIERLSKSTKDIDQLEKVNGMRVSLLREHRQLQTILGIDRTSRQDDEDTATILGTITADAKEFLDKKTIKIKCDHCKRQLTFGFILFHFSNDTYWQFQFKCPNTDCGKLTSLGGDHTLGA